jgi:LemA protein
MNPRHGEVNDMLWLVMAGLALGVVSLLVYTVGIYNGLVRLKHNVDRAWSNIDVLLKQRHDEIPKLVETVKGYMSHEKQVLQSVTEARAMFDRAGSVSEKGEADATMRGALGRLFAVAEAYPDLKADQSFRMLQERISQLEDGIADRREFFNHSVNAFNIRIEQIPDVVLANLMGLQPRDLFQAEADDRKDPAVSFER